MSTSSCPFDPHSLLLLVFLHLLSLWYNFFLSELGNVLSVSSEWYTDERCCRSHDAQILMSFLPFLHTTSELSELLYE